MLFCAASSIALQERDRRPLPPFHRPPRSSAVVAEAVECEPRGGRSGGRLVDHDRQRVRPSGLPSRSASTLGALRVRRSVSLCLLKLNDARQPTAAKRSLYDEAGRVAAGSVAARFIVASSAALRLRRLRRPFVSGRHWT